MPPVIDDVLYSPNIKKINMKNELSTIIEMKNEVSNIMEKTTSEQ